MAVSLEMAFFRAAEHDPAADAGRHGDGAKDGGRNEHPGDLSEGDPNQRHRGKHPDDAAAKSVEIGIDLEIVARRERRGARDHDRRKDPGGGHVPTLEKPAQAHRKGSDEKPAQA